MNYRHKMKIILPAFELKTGFKKFTAALSANRTALAFSMILGACGLVNSQTTLINPAAEGGFESGADFASNGWTVVNGTVTNKWFVGTVPTGMTNNSAYVSADNGVTNGYTNNSISVSHFYRDVTFPAGETKITLTFNYKVGGETNFWDGIFVSLAPTSYTPTASNVSLAQGVLPAPTVELGRFWTSAVTPVATATITIPASVAGNCTGASTMRLIFTWKNDGGGGANPTAVDAISLTSSTPLMTTAGGTFTIDNTLPTGGTNYASFTAAINDLNVVSNCGFTGPVVFNVAAGQTFNEMPPAITATGTAANTITFQKSGVGANPVITSAGTAGASDASIVIFGGDYFTFDGIDINNSGVTAMEFGYLIRNASVTNGAQNNVLKNLTIRMSRGAAGITYGVLSSSSTFVASAATGANSNNTFDHITIDGAVIGMQFNGGSTAFPDTGNKLTTASAGIRNSIINMGPTVATSVVARGVHTINQSGFILENTDISAVAANQSTAQGIFMTGNIGNSFIRNNSVSGISVMGSASTTSVAYGIQAQNSTSGTNMIRIANNMISNLSTSFTGTATTSRYAIGIHTGLAGAAATQSYEVYHNTVSIGEGLTPTYSNACYEIQNVAAVYKVQNNIFANFTGAQTGNAKHYAWITTSPANIGATGSISDRNDLYIANTTNGFVGRASTTDLATLPNWVAAITAVPGTDANSVSVTPTFVNNNTNLHLNLGVTPSQIESGGASLGVATDFDGDARPGPAGSTNGGATAPDMGADEFDGVPLPPPVITLNSVTPPAATQCTAAARLVSANVTMAGGTVLSVTLAYAVNGTPQTPITMANTSGSTWEGTIPVPTPANATISWSIAALSNVGTTSTYIGTPYADEPLLGVTASATSTPATAVCAGTDVSLRAQVQRTATLTLGAGASTTSGSGGSGGNFVSPFSHYWGGYKAQYVVRAAELTAMGLTAGNITSLAFDVTTSSSVAYTAFSMSIAPTASTTATATFLTGTFTDVYNGNLNVTTTGLNTLNFATPFNWDGTSNIVINLCWSNNNGGGGAAGSAEIRYDATAFTAMAYYRADDDTPAEVCGATSSTGTMSNRPKMVFVGNTAPAIQTVSWSDGMSTVGTTNPLTVAPVTTTTYTATVTAAGCAVTPAPSTTVTVNPLPSAVTATNSAQCGLQVPTASVASTTGQPTPTFKWYSAASGGTMLQSSVSATYTTAISTTTTFYVSEVDGTTGCESPRTAVTVTVNVPDAVSASASAPSICIGGTVDLTAANTNPTPVQSYTYTWTSTAGSGVETPVNGTPTTITPTAIGSYTYTLTAVDGGCTAGNSVSVTVNPVPTAVTANASDATICVGESVNLTSSANSNATSPLNYTQGFEAWPPTGWTFINAGDGNDWAQGASGHSGSNAMRYTYDADFDANAWAITNGQILQGGVAATVSFWYRVEGGTFPERLKVTVGTDATVAAQTTTLWNNNGGASINNTTWAQATVNFTPAVTGTYYFGFNCYSIADQYLLHVDDISITGTTTALPTYAWTSAPAGFTSSAQNPTGVAPTATTTYTVTASNSFGCSATANTAVTVNTLPTVDAGTDQTVCSGDEVTLAGSGATDYTWDNGVTDNDPFNATATTTYTVTGEDANGCTDTDQVTVTVNALPTVDAGAAVAVCAGGSVTLTATGSATSYDWDNSVTNGVAFTPVATATYTVTGEDANGCENTDQVVVTVNALPTVDAGTDQTVCSGASVTLSGSGATDYSWDNGVTNGVAFAATATTTYTVTGEDANGCEDTDQVTVTVNTLPTVDAGTDQTVCAGEEVTLSGSGAVDYTWDNGVTDGDPFDATATTTYTVTGEDANGCEDTDQVTVTVNALPAVDAGNDVAVCVGGSVTLTASGTATSYDWDNSVTDGVAFTPAATDDYIVTGEDANGCENSDTVTVTVNALPVVDAGGDVAVCAGNPVTLSGSGAQDYTWDNGVTDGVAFTPVATDDYIVTGEDANGCENADTVTVTVNALPTVDAGTDQTVCAGEEVTLSGSGADDYTWDNGVTDGVAFEATATTTYTVTGEDANGCEDTDQVTVTVNPTPVATATDNGDATITASAGAEYQWINCTNGQPIAGATSQTFTVTANGTYAVVVTNASDCSDTSDCVEIDYIGLNELTDASIAVFPNPTRDNVTITMSSVEATITVVDAQGKLLQETVIANGGKVDLSAYETGIYFLRIRTVNGSAMERVVKN